MNLTRRRALALATTFAGAAALPGVVRPVSAQQNWPQRSLRILVGTSPGGSPDIVARLLADKMAERLGQSVTVENNTGGGGGIAASMVSHSPPDGYNLTLLTAGYASGAAVGKFPFDGDNTFGLLTMVCAYPFVYAVPKDSPIKSFADMIERAKANPGKLTYVITSLGSVYHLIGSWVGQKAGMVMTPVPYRGSANAVTDVMGGRVDVMLDTATSGFPRIANGQFRALAVTSPERYPLLPNAPTVAETLPGVHYMSWLGMAAAPRTPRPIVDRLNAEIQRALQAPEIQAKLKEAGNIATPTTPEAMRQQIEDEIANWKQIVVANDIKVN
jgi:tripartite-type tricarboxylate transporter receptor subunit TctC